MLLSLMIKILPFLKNSINQKFKFTFRRFGDQEESWKSLDDFTDSANGAGSSGAFALFGTVVSVDGNFFRWIVDEVSRDFGVEFSIIRVHVFAVTTPFSIF